MYKIEYAKRLPGSDWTVHAISNIIPQEHVFSRIDKRFKTYYGVHQLFKAIEQGVIRVYGAFTEKGLLAGVCFGNTDTENNFVVHVMFCRNTDVTDGCLKCADAMIKEYEAEGVLIQSIIGYIPAFNRAAIRMAKRFGCVDCGETKEMMFIKDEYHYTCRIMKKKIER
jgi:L-amino acid N-acyltransferase YncA